MVGHRPRGSTIAGPSANATVIADRYSLDTPIGSGSSGTVWRGRDERLDRPVAIKRVELPDAVSEEDREEVRRRVLREARAAAKLNHRAATTVHDVLEQDDTVYLVMELVDAPDLTRIVGERGTLSPAEAAGLALPLLDALAAAHRRGIVHRDVKPSNVLVPADGPPKLTDFGIASVTDDPELTSTGIVLGSPAYMSPEQATGGPVGSPADLWGLGATLYFAVEGRAPFERDSAVATLHAVAHEPPRPMGRAGGLQDVISALLRRSPEDRPDAGALRGMLTRVRDGETAPAGGSAAAADVPTRRLDGQASRPAREQPTRPVDGEAGTGTDGDRSSRRAAGRLAALLAGLAVLALLAVVAIGALTGGAPGDRENAEDAPPADDARATVADEPQGEQGAQADGQDGEEGQEGRTAGDEGSVPSSWERSSPDGHPYTVAHPADWRQRSGAANNVDLVDPSTGAYLRVAWTDQPNDDPVADREGYSDSFAATHDGYRELTLEPTTFRGHDAALWEYVYRDGGRELHAIQVSWVADGRGYALNYQTPQEDWEEMSDLWPQLKAGFEVTG